MGKTLYSGCPKCIEKKNREEKLKEKTVPWITKRRENMRIDTYEITNEKQKEIVNRVKKYITNFKRVLSLGTCLCFSGSPGTGKTHLATSIGVDVLKAGYSVQYERMYDLLRRIKDTYHKQSTITEDTIIKRLVEFDLMIIDEVGLKTQSEHDLALTHQIIDARYEAVKPTIIVSNLSEKELESSIGERAMDRFYENHGTVFEFKWESFRRKTT